MQKQQPWWPVHLLVTFLLQMQFSLTAQHMPDTCHMPHQPWWQLQQLFKAAQLF